MDLGIDDYIWLLRLIKDVELGRIVALNPLPLVVGVRATIRRATRNTVHCLTAHVTRGHYNTDRDDTCIGTRLTCFHPIRIKPTIHTWISMSNVQQQSLINYPTPEDRLSRPP